MPNESARPPKAVDAAKSALGKKRKEIKARGLSRDERRAVEETELRPLMDEYRRSRMSWLTVLTDAVPFRELALGKRIDCTRSEYRQFAAGILEQAGDTVREALDMLAAFGTDAALARNSDAIQATPFCFITGSGHQYFLDTVRQLIDCVSTTRVREALFVRWTYRDEGLSMRWDPAEDKRYALLDSDPGPEGARTVWMANLLAYRALALFPCAPRQRGLATTGWTDIDGEPIFTWPIWTAPASVDTIRSLLQMTELILPQVDRVALEARGILVAYRVRRIRGPTDGCEVQVELQPCRSKVTPSDWQNFSGDRRRCLDYHPGCQSSGMSQ